MANLQRLTTEYVDAEDRIRLTGELAPGQVNVLWLTQRLLARLLPHLFQWLQQHSPVATASTISTAQMEALQGLAQLAARAELSAQPPVEASASSAAWLVTEVQVTQNSAWVKLVFKGQPQGTSASLHFEPQPLRQWLTIVRDQYQRGQWPMTDWPHWATENAAMAHTEFKQTVLH